MSKELILILTNTDDPHADVMVQILTQHREKVVRLDPADFPGRANLSVRRSGNEWSYLYQSGQHEINLKSVKSIWVRRPSRWGPPPDIDPEIGQFVQAERRQSLEGLWSSLDVFWVNDPVRNQVAEQKLLQLKLAAKLGLRVPSTIVTNDPMEATAFYEAHDGKVIYKTFSGGFFRSLNQIVYTSPLTPEHLGQIHRVRSAPCMFQEYVAKEFEVRSTVVGQEVFSAAIYSQEEESAKHDWRKDPSENLKFQTYFLPDDVQSKLLKMVEELGLAFGAIDLIVTPEGEHVFLEINPSGQFGFVETRTGLKIWSALADMLVAGKS
jgi:glutathione synthase/RimK-type ligase-like ATP-grasp enzyme